MLLEDPNQAFPDQGNFISTQNGSNIEMPYAPIPADDGTISSVVRTVPELHPARAQLVKQWQEKISSAKNYWAGDFKRMRDNMSFAGGDQWPGDGDYYIANITQRHLQQRTAALYAKNPQVVCKKRKRMEFAIWDGTFQTLTIAQQQLAMMQQTGVVNPQTLAFIQDFMQGSQKRQQMDRISKTLELLFSHTLDNQMPPFKLNMKQLVRRTLTTGVGYVKLGFKRELEKRPEDVAQVNVLTDAVKAAERVMADREDDQITDDSSELEVLRQQLDTAKSGMRDMVTFEGLTFDFPRSTSIVIDPACTTLRTFTGAKWIAHEFILTREDIQEIYNVDVKSAQSVDGVTEVKPTDGNGFVVWEIYEKKTGHVFTVMQGYQDYLRAPEAPDFYLERFWPFFPVCFNELEADGSKKNSIFPISDVELLKPIQKEYNRAREALRRHRMANRPRHATPAGALSDTDKDNLMAADGNTTIELQGLQSNEDIRAKLMPIPTIPLDPQVYNTDLLFQDLLRTAGAQEANLGGTGGGTATESSIAESSRMSSLSSNVDDLDDLLTELAKAGGQVLLLEMSQETVKEIVGPGALWPEMDREQVAKEIGLEIRAGSSGRPNKAMEIQNFERIMPTMIQIPGINPEWVAREAVRRLDDGIEFEDAWIGNVPSLIAQNAQAQPQPGDPNSQPNAQGNKGGQNAPSAPGSQSGGPPQLAPNQAP